MGPKSTVTGTVADRVRAQHGVSPVSVSPPTARLKNTEEAAALAVAMVLTLFVVTEDDLSATFTAAHLKKQLDACKIAKALGMPEVHATWLQQGFSKYNNKLSQAYGMIFTQTKSPDKGISDRTWTVRFTAARTRPSQAKCLAEVQKHRSVLTLFRDTTMSSRKQPLGMSLGESCFVRRPRRSVRFDRPAASRPPCCCVPAMF